MQPEYKMDRTAFEILSFEEADRRMNDHRNMNWQERLLLLRYLNSIAYGYANDEEPKMDKTVFSMGKSING
ncbi:MAG: hypothetical protein K2X48_15745 [Chitinophagaceae bacterium]|nr:hypothetical protein [Chitinophagaceae bacterium]